MFWALLFWLTLLIPGFAALRAFWRDALEAPGPVMISLSYLATLGLLSPLSIAGYATGAPLWLFSAAMVAILVAALVEIVRRGWWRELWPILRSLVVIEALFLLFDFVLAARVGTAIFGDASVHLGRARFLIDHGFNNMDPWVGEDTFFPIYHTNLLHALVASAAQITRVDLFVCWQMLLPVAKLLIAVGIFHFTWAIFLRPWPAWAAALFFAATQTPVHFLAYPNKLAPFWLIPSLIAIAIQAVTRTCDRGAARAFVVGMLVLAQIHTLYALFAIVILAPAIGVNLIWRRAGQTRERWAATGLAVALLTPAPFALISKVGNVNVGHAELRQAGAFDDVIHPDAERGVDFDTVGGKFAVTDDDEVVRSFWRGFGGGRGWANGIRWWILALGLALTLISPARWRAMVAISPAVVAALILYVPAICTLAVSALSATWLVGRLAFVFWITLPAISVGALVYWLERGVTRWFTTPRGSRIASGVSRVVVSVALVGLSVLYQQNTRLWSHYWSRAAESAERRWHAVRRYIEIRAWLEPELTRGETVLAPADVASEIAPLLDVRLIAPQRGSAGVYDAVPRARRLAAMLDPETDFDRRIALLQRYNIHHMLLVDAVPEWARPLAIRAMRVPGTPLVLVELRRPLLR